MQVLLPIDGSAASARAVEFLCASKRGGPGTVMPTLLHVHQPRMKAVPDPAAEWQEMSDREQAHAQALLAVHQRTLSEAGFTAHTLVRSGAPASTILEVAAECGASLVVMGTRGAGMLGGFALGSVALRVAPAAPCPVVLVKPDAKLPSISREFTQVVAPLDGSAVSDSAVQRLVALRDFFGPLHVNLVHFEPALTLLESIMPPHDDVLRRWCGEQSRRAVAAAAHLLTEAGISHEVSLLAGDAAPSVAELALRQGADLIAMATHGTGALHHATFGSVALKTVVLASVPVLLTH
ncbi:universal stress protein [Pelomonas sp. P7]|uniref:Universal stress protein n=1 Tax=Pelomonas caseinilytica TaxID=2906763 RepID=A0ABS8XMI0_9BURK|nr:universal stress protein [Pelomonas sp. P7]MCE4540288.1 universal stress protein [Pelomonas sp. P7]